MQSMRVRSLIGKNGLLQIQLPEIILVYESASPTKTTTKLSDFYGCIQDETFIRHPQPEQAEREPF
ncbi:MAG: hypothetical protein GPJ20_18490 [Microcystis aeruginosa BS13-10]|nr:hypothetical protein [Microcystis aeruginosa BS13-10]